MNKSILTAFLIVATSTTSVAAAEKPMILEPNRQPLPEASISYTLKQNKEAVGQLNANCAIPQVRISFPLSGDFMQNYESIRQDGITYSSGYLSDARGNHFQEKPITGEAYSIIDLACDENGWPKPARAIYIRKSDLPFSFE